jgi:hypothetical protein
LLALAVLAPLTLFIAVLRDFFRPERSPWTHWLGVTVFVLQAGMISIRALAT